MKCSKCGKEIANDSQFCEFCGAQMKKENAKRVDIRWALLPAMLIATITMGFASQSERLCLYGYLDASTIAFILSLCLFVISCWYAIRKSVPLSFIVVIGLLFGFSSLMLFKSFNGTGNVYYDKIGVSWTDDEYFSENSSRRIFLSTDWYHNINNVPQKELEEVAMALRDKLQSDGKTQCRVGGICTEEHFCTTWDPNGLVSIGPLITFAYLIYAFIANKKGWSF